MELVSFYKCLSDPTRLRIVNLLLRGPLCVCDIQRSLHETQVKMSKHLGYMKKHGLLTVNRKANWNFYEIATNLPKPVYESLAVIEANSSNELRLSSDIKELKQSVSTACC